MMKALGVMIGASLSAAIVAFEAMFALALLGHPQFGFLELWLAIDTVMTVVASSLYWGMRTYMLANHGN
jgi:hypothetical protein